MKRILILALLVTMLSLLPNLAVAGGQGRPNLRSGAAPRGNVPRVWIHRGSRGYRHGHPIRPYYHYPNGYYYQSFYPPAVVIAPYGSTYYQPRVVEVTSPYFCVLHNAGFVNRAGMVDHLAGTHKFPLESAAYFCPAGVDSCLYPVQ
jgi:hypothetical protein